MSMEVEGQTGLTLIEILLKLLHALTLDPSATKALQYGARPYSMTFHLILQNEFR